MKRNKWSEEVKKRDMFICKHCRKAIKPLVAHHIIPKTSGGKNTLDNGITLCWTCHGKAHIQINKNLKKQKGMDNMFEKYTLDIKDVEETIGYLLSLANLDETLIVAIQNKQLTILKGEKIKRVRRKKQ